MWEGVGKFKHKKILKKGGGMKYNIEIETERKFCGHQCNFCVKENNYCFLFSHILTPGKNNGFFRCPQCLTVEFVL